MCWSCHFHPIDNGQIISSKLLFSSDRVKKKRKSRIVSSVPVSFPPLRYHAQRIGFSLRIAVKLEGVSFPSLHPLFLLGGGFHPVAPAAVEQFRVY